MAEDESFLGRWSRLKQAERAATKAEPAGPPEPAAPVEPVAAGWAAEEIDLAALPPIEMLGPDSDYTPFLKPGVPAELQRRALRRAWVVDREIADFRAPADYDWNFNAPGYGALRVTDDVAEMLQRLAAGDGRPAAKGAPTPAEPTFAAAAESPAGDDGKVRTTPAPGAAPEDKSAATAEAAAQPEPEADLPLPERRPRHGGAVPT